MESRGKNEKWKKIIVERTSASHGGDANGWNVGPPEGSVAATQRQEK
jgi:hypothetical protein